MFINFILSVIIKYCVLLLSLEFSAIPTLQVDSCILGLNFSFFFFFAFSLFSTSCFRCHKMFIFSAPSFESAISQRSPRYIWGCMLFSRNQDVGYWICWLLLLGCHCVSVPSASRTRNICMPANLWYTHLKLLLHLTIFIY